VVWLAFEIVFIYFVFPETYGKTLEELTFCKWRWSYLIGLVALSNNSTVFDSEKSDRDALNAATTKVMNDTTVTEIHELSDKKV
jgi:hypothetical protein